MPDPTSYSCVLWDVDGTLVDASEGVLRRLRLTLEHVGRPVPAADRLRHWIGPPLYDSFRDLGGLDPEAAAAAVSYYRALGKADGFTSGVVLYPGVAEIVADADAAGLAQATASSKPEMQVAALMEHFGLAPHLTAIVGSTPDEHTLAAKADIVAEALRRLAEAGADVSRPVLVGDRVHDVVGGRAYGVPVVFVEWGFAEPGESVGAVAVASDAAALRALLLDPHSTPGPSERSKPGRRRIPPDTSRAA